MKKSPQIANLNDEDDLENEKMVRTNAGFFSALMWKIKNINWSGMIHTSLVFFERVLGKIRANFSHRENKSRNSKEMNRGKRGDYVKELSKDRDQQHSHGVLDDEVAEKIDQYQPKKKSYLAGMKRALKKEISEDQINNDQEEKIIKPMVSDRVVNPSSRAEMKDRLEGLLIERIAANPKDVEAYERLGEYYMEIDSLNDAKECFKQILKLDPKNKNVKYRMRILEMMIHQKQ